MLGEKGIGSVAALANGSVPQISSLVSKSTWNALSAGTLHN